MVISEPLRNVAGRFVKPLRFATANRCRLIYILIFQILSCLNPGLMRMQQRCWSISAAKASFPLIPWKYSGVEYFQYSHVNAGILFPPSCD